MHRRSPSPTSERESDDFQNSDAVLSASLRSQVVAAKRVYERAIEGADERSDACLD